MAADAWKKYNSWPLYAGNGVADLDNDTFKCQLHTSAYTFDAQAHTTRANLTNELSTANGYTAGGVTVAATFTQSTTTVTFDVADPQWTASGGSIPARRAVLYDDTPTSPADPLVAMCLLDNTPADVTVTAGNTLTIAIHANGVYQITGMT